ncbi:MAG: hypothetical protein RR311_03110, partial [Comamonas sp.]
SHAEWHREIASVAVPLVGPNGEVMALNCGGAAYTFTEEKLRDEVAGNLVEAARSIAHAIGGMVPPIAPALRPTGPLA